MCGRWEREQMTSLKGNIFQKTLYAWLHRRISNLTAEKVGIGCSSSPQNRPWIQGVGQGSMPGTSKDAMPFEEAQGHAA